MNDVPSLAQLIKQAIDNRLLDVHTAMIGKVERYDAEKQLLDVAPMLKRHIKDIAGSWQSEELPMLCDVPILFPCAGGYFISFPIQPGDFVQVIFNEANIEEWFDESAPTIVDNQRFTLQGAVAIPGIFPSSNALTGAHKTNFVMGRERGVQIHVDDQTIRLGSADAAEALAMASKVKEELEKFRSTFNGHVHAAHGSPTVSQIAPISDVACRKVVAE